MCVSTVSYVKCVWIMRVQLCVGNVCVRGLYTFMCMPITSYQNVLLYFTCAKRFELQYVVNTKYTNFPTVCNLMMHIIQKKKSPANEHANDIVYYTSDDVKVDSCHAKNYFQTNLLLLVT